MSDHREAIAEVLAAHDLDLGGTRITRDSDGRATGYTLACRCGFRFPPDPEVNHHRPHLADALLGSDVLAQIRAEARAEALREAADALNTTDHATETALQGVDHAIWFLRNRAEGSA